MTRLRITASLTTLALATAAPACAQKTAAPQWPAEVRAYYAARSQECRQFENGRLSLDESAGPFARAADFTGDGRPDYLVDVHMLVCSSSPTLLCGNAGCEYKLFVAEPNGRYREAGGFIGDAEYIVQNGRPLLRATSDRGTRLWGWDGRAFTIVSAGIPGRAASAIPRPTAAQPFGFTVNLLFTPLAAAELARSPRQMRLFVMYQGEPTAAHARAADPTSGFIFLGNSEVRVPAVANFYLIPGTGVNRAQAPWVRQLDVSISADVAAPARGRGAPILCYSEIVPLREARQTPPVITCRTWAEVR